MKRTISYHLQDQSYIFLHAVPCAFTMDGPAFPCGGSGGAADGGKRTKKEPPGTLGEPGGPRLKTAATYSPTCAVPSAWAGLTSLFGMGRGGTPLLSATWNGWWQTSQDSKNKDKYTLRAAIARSGNNAPAAYGKHTWTIPQGGGKSRAISSARLWRHRLYTCTLSTSSSLTTLNGNLILRPASHLDAFSAYPIPTWIPGGAPGGTTGRPEVSPTRSSRTSVRAAQISCAHDR